MEGTATKIESSTLLDVRNLVKHFPVEKSDDVVQAVDNVSFSIKNGETLGLDRWPMSPPTTRTNERRSLFRGMQYSRSG